MEVLFIKISNSVLLIMLIILKILTTFSTTIFLLSLYSLVVRNSNGQRITKLPLALRELGSQDPSGSRKEDKARLSKAKSCQVPCLTSEKYLTRVGK